MRPKLPFSIAPFQALLRKDAPRVEDGDVLRVHRNVHLLKEAAGLDLDVGGCDRIEYDHYGIYAHPGHVIQYTDPEGRNETQDGVVMETSLADFLRGAETFFVRRFPPDLDGDVTEFQCSPDGRTIPGTLTTLSLNLKDVLSSEARLSWCLHSGDEALRRARSRLGAKDYNLAFNNCEHFAMWCRTGVRESIQANAVIRKAVRGAALAVGAAAVAAAVLLRNKDRS